MSAAPCTTAEGTERFLGLARAAGLDICRAPPHLGAFPFPFDTGTVDRCVPRIFVPPHQAHRNILNVLVRNLKSKFAGHKMPRCCRGRHFADRNHGDCCARVTHKKGSGHADVCSPSCLAQRTRTMSKCVYPGVPGHRDTCLRKVRLSGKARMCSVQCVVPTHFANKDMQSNILVVRCNAGPPCHSWNAVNARNANVSTLTTSSRHSFGLILKLLYFVMEVSPIAWRAASFSMSCMSCRMR